MPKHEQGGCQCGFTRYRVTSPPIEIAACHCSECQRQSGSAFGMSFIVPAATFELTAGELQSFLVTCDSGRIKTCSFCPRCGCRICHQTGNEISIKAGTFDNAVDLQPTAHYWTGSKQTWVIIPAGISRWIDDGPSPS